VTLTFASLKFVTLTFTSPCIIIGFKWFHQQDATVLQIYYLTFMRGSTCFGRLPAHCQEHTTARSLWFNCWRAAAAELLVMVWQTSSFLRFLDHTQRRTTVGRSPLDEWLARHRDLYLTTHNTHNRQTSMPPVGFEPTISARKFDTMRLYAIKWCCVGISPSRNIYIFYLRNCCYSLLVEWPFYS
jgi:hypothetical protein